MDTLPKIIVIVGPTATGKTDLGILLAKKFNGEVVSADSRQIYKKMNIGTGKPTGEWTGENSRRVYLVAGVPHHLIDIFEPNQAVSLADYKSLAQKCIDDIIRRGKLPIIVGGTGLYIWSVVDNLDLPHVAPNKEFRKSLENKSLGEMVTMLEKIDPVSLARIDVKNPRRVIRALEVATISGKSFHDQRRIAPPIYNPLQIGILWKPEELHEQITRRIDAQFAAGFIDEVKALLTENYGWELPSMTSLGYKQIGSYLRGECSLAEAVADTKHETRNYAKRQLTWFRRDQRIIWVDHAELEKVDGLVKNFLDHEKNRPSRFPPD